MALVLLKLTAACSLFGPKPDADPDPANPSSSEDLTTQDSTSDRFIVEILQQPTDNLPFVCCLQ